MNQNDKDRNSYRFHKMFGPEDRNLPNIYIPKKMPKKKENFLPKVGKTIKDFFTLKPLG